MSTAIALYNPKFPHNVGAAIRSASCWRIPKLIWSGNRVPLPKDWMNSEEFREYRMPREERMKGYKDVELSKSEKFKDEFKGYVPVAIELVENSENLFDFEHPENAFYIFGPEDGGIPSTILQHCHRFVQIPTAHCLNLSAAINVVMSHRANQIYQKSGELITLNEHRGFIV
jgi:tRNA(Leu) C34 or U34 (ribose-2'-O)-methylase TrmL